MSFKFSESSHNRDSFASVDKMPKVLKKAIRKGAYISGKQLVANARNEMTRGSKFGRTYRIYRGLGGSRLSAPRLHRASAAGESPAVISGKLRASTDFKVRGSRTLEFGAGNSMVNYAKFLEEGTSRIAPRRYLRGTVRKLQNQVNTNISKEINKGFNSLGLIVTKV